jgi:hypothetical protein
LRTLRKPLFISKHPCAPRASPLFFNFAFAHSAQAIFFQEKRREALLIYNSIPSGLPRTSVILPNTANAHASDGVSGSLRLSR